MSQSKAASSVDHLEPPGNGEGTGWIRHFLGWDRPVLHAAADVIVADTLEGPVASRAVDLSRALIAVPGRRAGRRLTELLLDRAEAAGLPLRPPRITTTGALPEALYTPRLPPPGPVLDRLAWVEALEALPRRDRGVLLPTAVDEDRDRVLSALAGTLRSLQREVGGAGLDFAEVAAACRRGLLFSDEERWTVLARAQARARETLRRHGFLDREAARREALGSIRIPFPGALWIVGAPEIPRSVRTFVEALDAPFPVRILIGAPEALAPGFDAMGCAIPAAWEDEVAALPEAAIRVAADPGAQSDLVVERLVALGGEHSCEDVSIGVPDPQLVPCIVERLAEAGVPTRVAAGLATERTPVFRLLSAIADYLDGRAYDAFACLLRHPDLERTLLDRLRSRGVRGPLSALSDRYRARHLPSQLDRGALPRGGERSGESNGEAMGAVRDVLLTLLEPFARSRPLARWSDVVRTFLIESYGAEPLEPHREGDRVLLEVAAAIGGLLDELETIPSELDPPVPAHRAIRFLLEEMRDTNVPPEAEEGAVELLGWLELALDDAPLVVIAGVNEPHLPESVTADPFLPHGLRRALGLLDNEGRWARDLLHLRTIMATRPGALLIAGRRDAGGSPLRPSRLLLAEDPETVARRLIAFMDGDDPPRVPGSGVGRTPGPTPEGDGNGGHVRKGAAAGGAAESTNADTSFRFPPDPVLMAPAPPDRIRVTAFREILSDPYRYGLERVLGLEGDDDRARELDGLAFGGLAHRVLERFGEGAPSSVDARAIRSRLEDLLDHEVSARFGRRPLPAVRLQVEQLRLRLGAFAQWQAAWASVGWRIRGVERAFPGEGAAFEVDGVPILLRGKVDRVDENEDTGAWCILDYKTGDRVPTPEEAHRKGRPGEERWIDLQLPLYLRMAGALQDGAGQPLIPTAALAGLRAGYVALPRDPAQVGERIAEWSEAALDEALEVARQAIRVLRTNRFAYDPRTSSIRRGDPLGSIVGGGVLRLEAEEEGEDD